MVNVKKDLTGLIFGKWKVLYQVDDYVTPAGNRYSNWCCECQCENHTIKNVIGTNLTSGKTKSCGCYALEEKQSRIIDLTGKKFGRLTVIGRGVDYISPKGQIQPRWECLCECGNTSFVKGLHLRNGKVLSCGCYSKEQTTKILKKYNKYELCGEYYIGYDCHDNKFYFDKSDYDIVSKYCWVIDSSGYVATSYRENNRCHHMRMHELIMNTIGTDFCVDHIHGAETKNDNRRCNLRRATNRQNGVNKGCSKRNKSGYVGVIQNKSGTWSSQITVNKKKINLGTFKRKEDAILARKQAEIKYNGEFQYDFSQNIPYERIE